MPIIKIKDTAGKITSSVFTGYSLEPLDNETLLQINLPNGSIKYMIFAGVCEENMEKIKESIIKYFDNILQNNLIANIIEYSQFGYIIIGEEEPRIQFLAQKTPCTI